ncbi:MAG: IS66 family transposase [Cenarchaeum sp. SB0661_bin_35]|nr:IS66 family transposase [Cenarchaeum sp. SB0667_bin_13]MYC79308.1 IS66 family transposase [Cenarchaeum sp. SB0661_bin_35]MYI51350.1 IS66 family transposase [Cenarchaeum sp. SB0673_bin_9]
MMICGFELTDVDWSNQDVNKIVEFFSKKFDVQDREIAQQGDMIAQKDDVIAQLQDRIKQLEKEVTQTKSRGHHSKKSRSYNTRKYKDYPHQRTPRDRPGNFDSHQFHTIQQVADIAFCPICGKQLADTANIHTRKSEDVLDGRWTVTQWKIRRRYCKHCHRQYSATIPGVLYNGHFGTTIMAQIFAMRYLAISFEKIQTIIHMLFGRFIDTSVIIDMCNAVADRCEPLYNDMMEAIQHTDIVFGDDTGWFLNGVHWWLWAFITSHIVLFHLSPSCSKLVTEAILEGFDGIIVDDSHSSWNDVGLEKQRCILHYFRDMYRTLEKNNSPEYKQLFTELYSILKDAIKLRDEHQKTPIPELYIRHLQSRISTLANAQYTDLDCIRYAKRLRCEGGQLLTFLKHDDIPYHNNTSERALRTFALMRKVCYGNRSRRGIKTAEILSSIYATCHVRGINPYTFMKDYLDGKIDTVPLPQDSVIPVLTTA